MYFFLDIFFGITTLIIALSSSIVAIVCGGIGIKKDDSPGMAIAGLVLGSIFPILVVFSSILSPIFFLF